MSRAALVHSYPEWERDDSGEERLMWVGRLRIVSPRRARKLRKRGVPLMPLHVVDGEGRPRTPNGRARYGWFETHDGYEERKRTRMTQHTSAAEIAPGHLLERHASTIARLRAGALSLEEFRREFSKFVEQREAVCGELDALIRGWQSDAREGPGVAQPGFDRGTLVTGAFICLLFDFALILTSGSHMSDRRVIRALSDSVQEFVQELTAQDLADYAQMVRDIQIEQPGQLPANDSGSNLDPTEPRLEHNLAVSQIGPVGRLKPGI